MNDFIYTVETQKSFDMAVDTVVNETEKVDFRVLYIHDVQETLSKKGLSINSLKIIEICNAKNAFEAIQQNISLSLMLPCKINVYEKDGKVYISALRPKIIKEIFPDTDIDHLISEVDDKVKKIVDGAK
ncbi:DUF302 domain-containing protein [Candidatus Gottesmanbacteria bacterium]|nr:DUF302 domain-containing protein [Candidatus Gottesmanbacteria bacterium]